MIYNKDIGYFDNLQKRFGEQKEHMQHNLENPLVILQVDSVAIETSVMWDKEDLFSEIQRI